MQPLPYIPPNMRSATTRNRRSLPNESEMNYQYPLEVHSDYASQNQRFNQQFQYMAPSQISVPYQNHYSLNQSFPANYQYNLPPVPSASTLNQFYMGAPFYQATPYQNLNFHDPYLQYNNSIQQQYSGVYLYNPHSKPVPSTSATPTISNEIHCRNKGCHSAVIANKDSTCYQPGKSIFTSSKNSHAKTQMGSKSHSPILFTNKSSSVEKQSKSVISPLTTYSANESSLTKNKYQSANNFDFKMALREHSSVEETLPNIISTHGWQTDSDESEVKNVVSEIIESVSNVKQSEVNRNKPIPDILTQVVSVNQLIKENRQVKSDNEILNRTELRYPSFPRKVEDFDRYLSELNISSNNNGSQYKNYKDVTIVNDVTYPRNTFDQDHLQNTEMGSLHNESSSLRRLSTFVNLTERLEDSDKQSTNSKGYKEDNSVSS